MTAKLHGSVKMSSAAIAAIGFYFAGTVLLLSWQFLNRGEELWSLLTEALVLLVIALPMIRTSLHGAREPAETVTQLNRELQNEMKQQQEREHELQDAIQDLERFNAIAVNRESRIIELKREINKLLEKQGEERQYHTVCKTDNNPD